jgi:hypothetical protein
MSRADLVKAARSLGVQTEVVQGGKRGAKSNDWLRVDMLERCYGPNLGNVGGATKAETDAIILRAVDCASGKFGYLLSTSQYAIRMANTERTEYGRLCGLKRRRPEDEARLLRSARQWLEIARISQELHEVEKEIKL